MYIRLFRFVDRYVYVFRVIVVRVYICIFVFRDIRLGV